MLALTDGEQESSKLSLFLPFCPGSGCGNGLKATFSPCQHYSNLFVWSCSQSLMLNRCNPLVIGWLLCFRFPIWLGLKQGVATQQNGSSCELAIITKKPIVGIKLDRSKCFDRTDISVICAFAKAFGLDQKFLNVWTQAYQGCQRHVTVGQLIDPNSLSNCHCVAQGDCASILPINILMAAWAWIMENFSDVSAFCFFDDAYLYCPIQEFEDLKPASSATQLLDKLVG